MSTIRFYQHLEKILKDSDLSFDDFFDIDFMSNTITLACNYKIDVLKKLQTITSFEVLESGYIQGKKEIIPDPENPKEKFELRIWLA